MSPLSRKDQADLRVLGIPPSPRATLKLKGRAQMTEEKTTTTASETQELFAGGLQVCGYTS